MPVVPPPMSITVAPSSRSSSTSVASPAAIGAETSSPISRSQRAMQAPSERSAVVAASMICSRAVSSSQNRPRGSATPSVASTAKVSGSAWIDFAALGRGAAPALVHHAADVVLFHRASADRPLHVEQPRFRLAAGEVDGDGAQPRIGHVLGLADAGADRRLGLLQIDDAAAAHAAALLPAEAQHAQRAVAFRAADQAGDLGGADVQHAERTGAAMPRTRGSSGPAAAAARGATCRSCPLGSWRLAPWRRCGCAAAASSADAARGGRPGACRSRRADDRAARAAAEAASADRARRPRGPPAAARRRRCRAAGSSAARRRAPRRSTRFCNSGRSVSASISIGGSRGRARTDHQRQLAELARRSGRRPSGRRGRSARICPGSARWRTGGAPAETRRRCRAAGARPWRVRPTTGFRCAARASSTEKPRIGSPLLTPSAARSSGSGVLARPSITTSVTRRPAKAGGAAEPFAQRGERAARRRRMHRDHADQDHDDPNAPQPAGRSRRFCRRSSSFNRPGRSLDRVARTAGYARHVAFSTIQAQSCGKLMPRCAACSGSSDVGVRPGCVLISSSTRRPGSPAVSS